jgi:hypothetical protein
MMKKNGVTIIIGVFFDGTGNNSKNTDDILKAFTKNHGEISNPETKSILSKYARDMFDVSGVNATSYIGYYSNIYLLSTLYKKILLTPQRTYQYPIYIEGIGTEAGKPDNPLGEALGVSDTGVIAKTGKAISQLSVCLKKAAADIKNNLSDDTPIFLSLQFDIFGFSRGAAAARHFANLIHADDVSIISALSQGLDSADFTYTPAGTIRFIGLFDTVAAIGLPMNGHTTDTGEVALILRPGIAKRVFHITAQNECRFNFALNSVKPAWPELVLPGAHSDIGGGYLPVMKENLFLTHPETDTVLLSQPGDKTRGYQQTLNQLKELNTYPSISPIIRTNNIIAKTWYDDRSPTNRYGEFQKRSYAALTLSDRIVNNDWSKVVLRVMLDAAQEAGVQFDEIPRGDNFDIPKELIHLCEKAIAMGKSLRSGQSPLSFSQDETDIIAKKYIHCSANWNAIETDKDGHIRGGAAFLEIVGFINRPDVKWYRTVYDMEGKKLSG